MPGESDDCGSAMTKRCGVVDCALYVAGGNAHTVSASMNVCSKSDNDSVCSPNHIKELIC